MLSTVWGARRRNTGPMPLYKPMRPSVWQTFSMQSEKPRYRRPWRQIRETDRSVRLSLCQKLSDDIISFDEIISAHPTTLIHRLIVQPGTDDVKGCHGKRHHDSTHHGCDQGREPVVWSEPLMWMGKKKKNRLMKFDICVCVCVLWWQLFSYRQSKSVSCEAQLPGHVTPSLWPRWRLPAEQLIPPWLEARPRSRPSTDQSNLLFCRWWQTHRRLPVR